MMKPVECKLYFDSDAVYAIITQHIASYYPHVNVDSIFGPDGHPYVEVHGTINMPTVEVSMAVETLTPEQLDDIKERWKDTL
jgi:hypothetical protein